ncbi:alpha/beta fold hydrolase [Agrobacterium vitis]|uniref:alpha/beta fold hydrolase n=1 Tax=Agrobacterium vitis TaxID=373 RepID=UPI00403EDE32
MEMLLLHALPFDGSMWADQMHLLPGSTFAPTLYSLGENIEEWAVKTLELVEGDHIIVVGCSIGGSCALEVAALAPDRIAALVLIGTKARHRPEPAFQSSALKLLQEQGPEAAWETYWAPLFSRSTDCQVVETAKTNALRQSLHDIENGVRVFHTRPSRDQVLSSLPKPILVVTGEDDIAPGLKTSSKQAKQAQHGRLQIVPDCGHYVPLERPGYLNGVLNELILSLRPASLDRNRPNEHFCKQG